MAKSSASTLVASAILGLLSGAACAETQPHGTATPGASVTGDKASCGNHEPGKCAATDTSKPATSTPLTIKRTETIEPGKLVEVNLSFASVVRTKASFKASSTVSWNVHSHPAGSVVEHQRGAGSSGDIVFQPDAPGVYSFMWKNDGGAAVTIELTLSGDPGVAEMKH